LAIGAAFAGIVVGGVKMAIDLETSFSKIQGLVGLSAEEVDVLREAAKRLGPQFGRSANEAAEALFFITSAGLRGSEAIDVLEASLKGAAIGLGDTQVIADLATSAMNAFGSENLSGAEAVDVLAEAVRLGKLAPEELAGSMGQVLPIASAMGVSFQEVGAVMAAMSRTGTNAAQASTQLRGIMTSLLKPTQSAERALRDMGFTSQGLRESIKERGLLVTLQELTEAFDGNEAGAEAVFGNVRALSGVMDLFGESSEITMEILEEMTDGLGVLDDAFLITEDTVGFKAAKAFEAFKSIALEIGDAILPLVADILETMLPHIENVVKAVKEFVETKLGPFISGLKENKEFQTFLDTIAELFFDIVPEVLGFAANVAILAGNITNLLKPALSEVAGEGKLLNSFARILDTINFFLAELNTVNIPGFTNSMGEMNLGLELLINPLGGIARMFEILADFLDSAREAWIRFRDSGFNVSGLNRLSELGRGQVGFQGSIGGRAAGGSVMGGNPYIVGERGPELFVPNAAGQIVPNHRIGGGSSINVTVNAGMGADGAEVGRKVVDAIRQYERRSGKVFASA
jgi:TP901 family phage tail tape measure protein